MEEATPRLTQLLAEVAALRQQVASLSVQVQTQEAVLTTLQASSSRGTWSSPVSMPTLAELQDTLAEQGLEKRGTAAGPGRAGERAAGGGG
jgi:hypothetical protein